MKITKSQLAISLVSILILVTSLVVLILQYTIPFDFMTHPLLNFLFINATGFSIITIIIAIKNKSAWFYFITSILFALIVIYIFVQLETIWWIGLIAALIICIITAILSFVTMGSKTESIALNTHPDYKNYEQRRAEKQAQEEAEEKKELPKIKSFKD